MPNKHPLSKESELIEAINAMVESGVDQNRLEEILAEAKKMQGIGGSYYVSAKRVMGMVAAMRGDVTETDNQFNAAITHGGETIETLTDYAISLWNLREIRRNLELLDTLLERAPDNPQLIQTAIHNHWAAYDIDGVRSLFKQAEKLKLSEDKFVSELTEKFDLDTVSNLLKEAGATWQQVCARIELTSRVLNKLGIYSPAMHSDVTDGIVSHSYLLATNLENVMRAEDAINEAIANEPFSPADRVIYFSCARA